MTKARDVAQYPWWHFWRPRLELYEAIKEMDYVVAISEVTAQFAFAVVPSRQVFSHTLKLFASEDKGFFATLQSRVHELWVRAFGSSLEDRIRYTPSDCFETFPLPAYQCEVVHDAGAAYESHRASIMSANHEGLTKTYNRFHDPHEQSEGILELRRLHGLMDGAVLRAYGWDDLAESARCEFLLDYEEEEDDSLATNNQQLTTRRSRKKKPWRLRWPDEFRDEVLARLLELNEQRHKVELLVASSQLLEKKEEKEKAKKRTKRGGGSGGSPLLDVLDDEAQA